jgi:hypothetical protein
MKNAFPLLMAAMLVMALGCNEGTPGGPGVKKNASSASTSSSSSTTTQETPSGSSTTETTKVEVEKPALPSETKENTAPAGTDANPIAGDPENSFRLDAPNLATTIKQGEKKVVTIGIARSKNFDQDVTLMFEDVPTGVTIDPAEPMIKHGEKEVKLNISAAADAAVNDFTIKIIGHPATGPDATNKFNLTVSKP